LIIGVTRPRQEIYRRADARIETMLANGWLDEVQGLLEAGYTEDMPGMSAIGYPQLAGVIRGDYDLEHARREIIRLTHQYVRRQANWFKLDDPRIHWFDAQTIPEPQLVIDIEELIRTKFPDF
jgi:tRNA dimethylallyltransferase